MAHFYSSFTTIMTEYFIIVSGGAAGARLRRFGSCLGLQAVDLLGGLVDKVGKLNLGDALVGLLACWCPPFFQELVFIPG